MGVPPKDFSKDVKDLEKRPTNGSNDPGVTWLENNVPMSPRFDDSYFSRQDGRDEVCHVFLQGNDLPMRWQQQERFTIGELGFGTGLSFLETLRLWRTRDDPTSHLDFVSFEQYPVAVDEIRQTIRSWPDLLPLCDELRATLRYDPGWNVFQLGTVRLVLGIGDANDLIDCWPDDLASADAWFLDGFSPNKNPELWNADLMAKVAARTREGGTFATFTAAGWVRRNLQSAGFLVRKTPGYGRKRDMACGMKTSP